MFFNFVCQVDRLNSNIDCQRHYILNPISFECTTSYDDEKECAHRLAQARHHVGFVAWPKSLENIAAHRESVLELKEHKLFDEQKGGVQLWLPDGPTGALYVNVLSGSDGLGDVATMADLALQNEHLNLQFSVNVVFSKFEENPYMPKPITFEMFCKGARMYVPNIPDVGLVRRHAK